MVIKLLAQKWLFEDFYARSWSMFFDVTLHDRLMPGMHAASMHSVFPDSSLSDV